MFYFHEILKKKGKFGIIWLAATAPRRIDKRDVYAVDVVRSSNDIIEVLTQYPSMAGRRRVHFSLYLSSQLMFGLVSIHKMKASILMDELRTLAARMHSFKSELSSVIDLTEPLKHYRVTLDEPDFDNVPIDFGNFGLLSLTEEISISLPKEDFFIVATPQSSGKSEEEGQENGGISHEAARFFDVGDEHTARVEDVTMQEEAPIPQEEIVQIPQEDGGLVDFTLPHFLGTDVVEPVADSQLLEIEPEIAIAEPQVPSDTGIAIPALPREETAEEQLPLPQPQLEPEPEAELPATAELTVQDVIPSASAVGPDVIEPRTDEVPRDHPLSPSHEEDDRRHAEQRSSSTSEETFVLQPVPTRGRRRRPRHLIIDRRIEIPPKTIKRNIETSDEILRPFTLPGCLETAESMLSRFGLRTAARGSKQLWPNPRTLPEPNDPARFGHFGVESVTATTDVSEVILDSSRFESREEPRAEDTREESREVTQADLSGIPSRSSRVSRILQESRDRTSVLKTPRASFIQGITDISVPDLSGVRPEFEKYADIQAEPEPVVEPQISTPVVQRDIIDTEARDAEAGRRDELPVEPEVEPILVSQMDVEPEAEPILVAHMDVEPGTVPEKIVGDETEPDISVQKKKKTCTPPPREEKTPPPPSPSLPRSPLLDHAMLYIIQAMNESANGQTTFSSVLSRTPRTKVYVAKMFSLLLTLHKYQAIIVDQPELMEEIYIYKGGRFEEYMPE